MSASYSNTPTLYQSAAGPTRLDAACSGAMYAAVPTTWPDRDSAAARSTTRPKSTSTTRPSRATSTLDDLTSRWTLPASCRALSPVTSPASAERRCFSSKPVPPLRLRTTGGGVTARRGVGRASWVSLASRSLMTASPSTGAVRT